MAFDARYLVPTRILPAKALIREARLREIVYSVRMRYGTSAETRHGFDDA